MTHDVPPMPVSGEAIGHAIKNISAALARRNQLNGLTPASIDLLWARQGDYLETLAIEAIRVADREQAETVQVSHVAEANRRLGRSRESRLTNVFVPIGGIVAGAGISQAVDVMTATDQNPATTSDIAWMLVLVLLGSVMLSVALARSFGATR